MALTISSVHSDPQHFTTPCLGILLPALETPHALPQVLTSLDALTEGALSRLISAGDFRGKKDEVAIAYPAQGPTRILLVGIGATQDVDRTVLRRGAAIVARRTVGLRMPTSALWVPKLNDTPLLPQEIGQVLAEGVHHGAWQHDGRTDVPNDEQVVPLNECAILHQADDKDWDAGVVTGHAIGAGHTFARNLQMLPGNVCTPSHMATVATDLAKRHDISVTILDEADLRKEGMGALLAVGQGSEEGARLIVLEYRGADTNPIVLVGKGISFDTGGISLKPALNMEEMKFDMSGAAAVLGAFEALGRLRPNVHVVGIIPSAENMPSGRAVKPGDVITSHQGKTIEVINTDAEGRLVLADALSYAQRFTPMALVDAATLTGAIVIGLGHHASGVMGTDEAVLAGLESAGLRSGERVWRMPLWEEYREALKSDVADLKNTGGRPAGSITAAWFLREFVGDTPWAHIDIAGTAYTQNLDATQAKGPTGAGTRLFLEFVLSHTG